MIKVIKRNGKTELFDPQKIENAIFKAFDANHYTLSQEEKNCIFNFAHSILEDDNIISVESIQDLVEKFLFDKKEWFEVGKAYMLYREQHKQARLIKDKLSYIHEYTDSKESATNLSNTDDNANSNKKTAATLEGELYKDTSRTIQRSQMKELLAEINSPYRDQYIKDLEHHIIYQHDESCPILKPYCSAYTLYPLLVDGTSNVDGTKNHAPHHLSSFCGQFQNLVFLLSAQKKGAGAYGEFFNFFSYFCEKEWGENYYKQADAIITNENCKKQRTIGQTIDQYFQSVTHYINQPASNRGYQSPFTNFNVFDSYYWHTMFDDFTFPDGTKPHWDAVNWLQKRYMQWLNEERTHTLLTFPVMTVCLLTDGKDVLDKEYKDFITTQWAAGDSFFVYLSENADSISSCCFSKDTKVLWKSSYDGVHCTTFEELHNLKWTPNKQNLKVYHNGSWVLAKSIKLPNRKMYRIKTQNNKEFVLSDNHINITYRGEVHTSELTEEDYLMFNTKPLEAVKENDEHLTYEQGLLLGMFIGDGSYESYVCEDGSVHNFCLSLNEEKYNKALPYLSKICEVQLSTPYNNVYPVRIHSKELVAFLMRWTGNKPGETYAWNKKLNINCILQSKEFRQGILDGWYLTDGGNSNRCYTISKELVEAMEILLTSLGKQCVIDVSDRTDEAVVIRGQEFSRNYPLYCIRWYSDTNARVRPESGFKWKNNSIYWKISSIEEIEYTDDIYCFEMKNQDEPYFTLPSGLITHNCRLRNEITENTFSSTTGLTGVQTGSCNVMTLNLNRIVQDFGKSIYWKYEDNDEDFKLYDDFIEHRQTDFKEYLQGILNRVYDYQKAYKTGLYHMDAKGMFPQTKAGYISFDKLYCTIGVNGLNEAARFLGLTVGNNKEYMDFASWILGIIKDYNKQHSEKKFMFNLEIVPSESLGVKNYNWDKSENYYVPDDENLYNSYIYNAHDDTSVLDKIAIQGGAIAKSIDGGQASHINLQENLDKEQYTKLLEYAVKVGNSYLTFNIPQTQCDKCGFIAKHPFSVCPECGSDKVTMWTRIVGYLRPLKAWSDARQKEGMKRYFCKSEDLAGHGKGL